MLFEPAWRYTREVKTSVAMKALEESLEGRNAKWRRCKWSEVNQTSFLSEEKIQEKLEKERKETDTTKTPEKGWYWKT